MTECVVCPGAKPREAEVPRLVCFGCSNRYRQYRCMAVGGAAMILDDHRQRREDT